MLFSTDTQVIAARMGFPDALRVLAEAGFTAYDFSIFDHTENNPVFTDRWRAYTAEIKAAADASGIVCNQAHAPHPTKKEETPENHAYNEKIFDTVVRAMEAAASLGAKAIVVHPIQHLDYSRYAEELFAMNMDFYRALAPYAKRFGIQIALENMWQNDGDTDRIVDSTCAPAAEFIRYFDTLGDDCFTCCLDLGHCPLCGHDAAETIRAMGADRIGALHIHDNDFINDQHTLPYLGRTDWDAVLFALHDVGYRGDFTYEAHGFVRHLPTDALPSAFRLMADLAKIMAAKI